MEARPVYGGNPTVYALYGGSAIPPRREFERLAQDHIAEMAIQKQVDQREAERDQPPPQVQMNPDDPKHKWTCVPIWHLTKMFTVRVCNAAEVVLPKSFGQKKPKKGAERRRRHEVLIR